MSTIEVQLKKWGNSLGVIIPKELAEKENLQERDTIVLNVEKKPSFSDFFGRGKRTTDTQKIMDEIREEWEMK